MTLEILPSRAKGRVSAPPSKSMAHRLLICAALAEGVSTVRGISDCEDVRATLDCLSALGIDCTIFGDTATVHGKNPRELKPRSPLPCRESGSTLRFLLPIGWLVGEEVTYLGAPSLLSRPMDVYETLAKE